jgi:O-antigen/teichoic acid export membrane protein
MTTPNPDALDRLDASRVAAHGAALRLASYGASLALGVVAIRMLATHLGTQFGTYTVVSSIAAVAVGSADAGLSNLALREGTNAARAARGDLLANLLGLRITLCLAGIVLGVAFAALTGRASTFVFGVAAVGVGVALGLLQQAVTVHLQLELRNGVVAVLELVKTASLTAAYGVFVLLGAGLTPFYLAPVIAGLVVLAATALVVPLGLFRPQFERASWARALRSVLPFALAAAAVILYFRVTQITMGYIATAQQTRDYALAFRMIEALSVIPGLVGVSALPLITRARASGPERLRPLARSLAQTALVMGCGLATATAASASIAIRLIGGPPDSPSIAVLQVLAVALAFTFPLVVWSFLLLALERIRAVTIGGAIAAVSALVLALTLVPPFGATGGAVATLVAEGALAGTLWVSIARFDRHLLPLPSSFLRALLAAVPGGAIVVLTRDSGALLPLMAIPVFAVSAILLRAVPAEIWDILRLRRA